MGNREIGNLEIGQTETSNPKSEISNCEVQFAISDFGFEVSVCPISKFPIHFYVSTMMGSMNGRFAVFFCMNFLRSFRIFSLITV